MPIGDKVTITNTMLHKLYGIKPTDEFEVKLDDGKGVFTLNNGWNIKSVNTKPVLKQREFNIEEAVNEQIANFIDEDYAFTAFDVTKALRYFFTDENIPHGIVQDTVHTAMKTFVGYERLLIDVGKPVKPWLYFPEGYDPRSYKPGNGAQTLSEKFGNTVQLGTYSDGTYEVKKNVINKIILLIFEEDT